jgi:hypothetical protein
MTERRPAYCAHSGTTDPHSTNHDTALAIEGHFTVVPSKPDILLLIPVLQSAETPDNNPVCLHLIHLDNGGLGLCSSPSLERCPCCMHPVCEVHCSKTVMRSPSTDCSALLCQTCEALAGSTRWALHCFVTGMNESAVLLDEQVMSHASNRINVDINSEPRSQESHPMCQRKTCPNRGKIYATASRRVALQTTQQAQFPTTIRGLHFPSSRTIVDLCVTCYHILKHDQTLQMLAIMGINSDGQVC